MCEEVYLVRLEMRYSSSTRSVNVPEGSNEPTGTVAVTPAVGRGAPCGAESLSTSRAVVEPEEPPGLPPLDSLLSLGCFRMRVVLFPQRLERHAGGGRISRS